MFNKSKVIDKYSDLVGYQAPLNPEYDIIDATNLLSTSGRYFTDNELVKIEFLKDNLDYADAENNEFNIFLVNLRNRAITSVIDRVFDKSDFIDRQMLYRFANNPISTDVLPDGFVGYKINKSLDNNIAFEITRTILEFQGTGSITLHLFQSNRTTPLFSETVSVTSTYQEAELNWKVDNTDVYEGDYYFGYFTDGMSITPIKRDYQNANLKSDITHLCFENIKFITATGTQLPDLEDKEGASECWGLNPDVSVYNDYTNVICQNSSLFAFSIQLQGQIYALQQMLGSIRSNQNERFGKDIINKIAVEIDGIDTQEGYNRVGLKTELTGQINRIKKELYKIQNGYFTNGFELNTLK